MDGFCWLGELDLTLFYTIEGYFDNLKSLMTENDRSPHIEVSSRFCSLSHAARYSERSSDSGQNADGYLQNCFPSVRFHLFNV